MQRASKKLIGVVALLVVLACGAVVVTIRAIRTDVDDSIAQVHQNYTCPQCGFRFPLTISDAAAMRRSQGDIICPKCRNPGALTDASASLGEFMTNRVPAPSATEEESEDGREPGARPKKPSAPTPSLTKSQSP